MSPQSHAISLAVPPEPTDHLEGSEHARVTLLEYGDFECPSCKVAVTTPKLLLERFPNKIRFIFRHFPLQEAHPHALMAAEATKAGRDAPLQLDESADLYRLYEAEKRKRGLVDFDDHMRVVRR